MFLNKRIKATLAWFEKSGLKKRLLPGTGLLAPVP